MTFSKFLNHSKRWILFVLIVGLFSGSASAIFLVSLDWATQYREQNLWIIALLPAGGFLIGWFYYKYGKISVLGNNLLLQEIYEQKNPVPLRMTPMVLLGTVLTHLFGGSAGREGTAVQMGGSLADQLSKWFDLSKKERRLILICGVAGGFASVFGTPLAGAFFGLEWMLDRKLNWSSVLPTFLTAFIADWVCQGLWGVGHTVYEISEVPSHTFINFLWVIPAAIAFGLSGKLFAESTHFFSKLFSKSISYPPLRPLIGGLLIATFVWISDSTEYLGLGVPRIVEAFETPLPWYDFLAKTGLTSFTLGAGFKGGEVTPLFFTGATLGNALSTWIPLPLSLMAGIGLVGVFSGATNTPVTCTLMGLELFGMEAGFFLALSCVIAYLASGQSSIYSSQDLSKKPRIFRRNRDKN
ncbi:voltage-gated chloride channel family protein [Algoriphagus sediminis]|uniref:Voltage-gated chloride channel family protein n=1 Tax=Algoriphagus sediminis TaxID=3057113 RepID=A0ABT7YBP5_9BACT|nr:voltage-gated chloride channel family protein [Algoriphagus sediminis]MDN3203933.1 voltage-gated chloride channel family protein [Algoriphagus sediminis]